MLKQCYPAGHVDGRDPGVCKDVQTPLVMKNSDMESRTEAISRLHLIELMLAYEVPDLEEDKPGTERSAYSYIHCVRVDVGTGVVYSTSGT